MYKLLNLLVLLLVYDTYIYIYKNIVCCSLLYILVLLLALLSYCYTVLLHLICCEQLPLCATTGLVTTIGILSFTVMMLCTAIATYSLSLR
jgi:hypothetical protein